MYLLPSHKISEAFSFYMWFMWLLFIYLFIVFLAMEKTTSSIHPICTRFPLHLATQPWVLLFECLSCLYIFLLCSVLPIKQRNGQTQQSAMKTLNSTDIYCAHVRNLCQCCKKCKLFLSIVLLFVECPWASILWYYTANSHRMERLSSCVTRLKMPHTYFTLSNF